MGKDIPAKKLLAFRILLITRAQCIKPNSWDSFQAIDFKQNILLIYPRASPSHSKIQCLVHLAINIRL